MRVILASLSALLLRLSTSPIADYFYPKVDALNLIRHQPLYAHHLPPSLNLLQTSIEELGLFLSNGSVTSVDLVKAYSSNIYRDNHQGLALRAIIQTAPYDSVIAIASKLDDERAKGNVRGLLHGIPVLVKDNMATDVELGMDTSAGNFALKRSKVKRDAEVVRKLREAGAIIIAKANLQEFSAWKSYARTGTTDAVTSLSDSWSAVGGRVSSAYVKGGYEAGGNPLGSSSGSAVGVSAGFAAAALGSDTTGSIIYPANRAALFVIRPTTGLVSTKGVVPITADLDTVGPIGFTARDTAILLDILTFDDGRYLKATESPSLKSLRLGLVRNNFLDIADGRDDRASTCVKDIEDSLRATIGVLERDGGATVVQVNANLTHADIKRAFEATGDILSLGMKEDLESYLEELEESLVRTLRDIIEWNEAHADIEFTPKECCQQRLLDALLSPGRNSTAYVQAWKVVDELYGARGLEYLFKGSNVDALVFSAELGRAMGMVGAMGYAAGTVPMGYCENGLPFGILIVVKPNQEEKLFEILAGYEAIMPKRKIPEPMA